MKWFNIERAGYVSNFLVQQEQDTTVEQINTQTIENKLNTIINLLQWETGKQEGELPQAIEPTTVQLYYFNELEDSKLPTEQQINTSSILSVDRTITASDNLIADTIKLLLQWELSEEEKDAGFVTELPHADFVLLDSKLDSDGTLTLTFSEVGWFTTGWSARMLILSNSIKQTALQFAQVQRVIFEPDTLFQP